MHEINAMMLSKPTTAKPSNTMRDLLSLVATASLLLSPSAHADWGQGGAAYKCDTSTNVFTIEATMDSSGGQIQASPGFTQLKEERNHVECTIEGVPIEATIFIGKPQPRGMCGGIGGAEIRNLRVNDVATIILSRLGSPCRELRGLVHIEVRIVGHNAIVKQCSGVWDWGLEYINAKCDTSEETIAND